MSIIPSITGKIELVYEGEQEGADEVARTLIDRAIMIKFEHIFPEIEKLQKEGVKSTYSGLINWFDTNFVELNYSDTDSEYQTKLISILPLSKLVETYTSHLTINDQMFCREIILWALTVKNKLDMSDNVNAFKFESLNLLNNYIGK
jgi:magnesium chelatase subunit I